MTCKQIRWLLVLTPTVVLGVLALATAVWQDEGPPERKTPPASRDAADDDQPGGERDRFLDEPPVKPPREGERPALRGPRGDRMGHRGQGPGGMRPDEPGQPQGGNDEKGPGRPGHPGEGRPGEGPPPMRELTPERIEEIMNLLKEHMPRQYERLSELKRDKPDLFMRQIHRFAPIMMRVLDADPAMRRLLMTDLKIDQDLHELRERYRDARNDAKAREEIVGQMRKLLEQQFDVRMEKSKSLIAGIEKRLAEQKQLWDERTKNRESMIDRKLRDMTGPNEKLGWPE